jgi:predicted lipid carrier protein YhbT
LNSPQSPPLLPARLAGLVSRLPQWPPSAVVCAALNLLFLPTLDAETKQRLMGRVVSIQVSDAGLDCRIRLASLGFLPALRRAPEVTICACAWDYYRLARRLEDPDTLFFSRRLTIDGDTELGLLVKNALDAIDWSRLTGRLGAVIDRLRRLAERRGARHKPYP